MSFLWGNKRKGPPGTLPAGPPGPGGLPPATRDISSAHGGPGEARLSPTPLNGVVPAPGLRDGMERRGTVGSVPNPTTQPLAAAGPLQPAVAAPQVANGDTTISRPRADSEFALVSNH
jgi:hypothetical protein